MSGKNAYSRRISSEEEREGYFLVLKNKLPLFPVQGQPFNLVSGPVRRRVKVESYHCQCRGPDLPHEHYLVRWPGLRKGQKVMVSQNTDKPNEYQLTVE